MIPNVPTAQRSKPPPVNRLYIPKKPLVLLPPLVWKYVVSKPAFKPGQGISEANRQTPKTTSVKTIRDLSSGILKQLSNVLKMEENISALTWPPVAALDSFSGQSTRTHRQAFQSWP